MTVTKTAPTDVGQIFGQAIETFETALKTGLRIQEETAKQCTDMLGELGSPE